MEIDVHRIPPTRGWIFSILSMACCLVASPAGGVEFDLTPHADASTPLENPHKGWYHHFPDNHLTKKYVIARDEDLLDFPGMDHLYMRLAWAYLEPREGQFDWPVIDRTIEKWTAHGLGIAFRISCRETSTDRIEQQFATPRWVMQAGAQGDFYYKGEKTGPSGPWEPVFDDPVFLEKLEGFLKAFGARYDGKPWLRYVDIGSIGDWGEGHTSSGSRLDYDFQQRKRHLDLYRKYFPNTQLVLSDDFVYCIRDPQQQKEMRKYVIDHGMTYRDDSILVDWYITAHSKTDTVRSPEFFEEVWTRLPTILELEHYASVKRLGNWDGQPDSSLAKYGKGRTGADYFRGAVERLHATYIGYHGLADQWLAENPELTAELLNRCGYWYFLHRVTAPDVWKPGRVHALQLRWENRGAAPAYHDYDLTLRLEGPQTVDVSLEAGNRKWLPSREGRTHRETYGMRLPETTTPGRYHLKLKLHSKDADRDVFLGLRPELLDENNFYRIGDIVVED